MDETILQENPGLFSKVKSLFARTEVIDDTDLEPAATGPAALQLRSSYRYTVTVRRQIMSFEDAMAAANGLKSGEQQVLNLSGTEPQTRQKIVDFMCGVNFAQEGTWEELGDNVFLIAPANAYVEVVPATGRGSALRN